jgi:hypothetical protein
MAYFHYRPICNSEKLQTYGFGEISIAEMVISDRQNGRSVSGIQQTRWWKPPSMPLADNLVCINEGFDCPRFTLPIPCGIPTESIVATFAWKTIFIKFIYILTLKNTKTRHHLSS